MTHNPLSFALQHGYTNSVELLLSHIDTYIELSTYLPQDDIDVLDNILFGSIIHQGLY
ncbi:MAG: hypothetical protein HAW62_04780 [Endozoicomonadaceae bacterium]|nr:hypothetical protein [Endozoicomonadaceae bacterium]